MEFNRTRIEVFCEVERDQRKKWLVTINFLFCLTLKFKLVSHLFSRCFKDEWTEVRIFTGTESIINKDLETKAESFGWVSTTLLEVLKQCDTQEKICV